LFFRHQLIYTSDKEAKKKKKKLLALVRKKRHLYSLVSYKCQQFCLFFFVGRVNELMAEKQKNRGELLDLGHDDVDTMMVWSEYTPGCGHDDGLVRVHACWTTKNWELRVQKPGLQKNVTLVTHVFSSSVTLLRIN
jgi:hypothetical protein